jgi:hypothetical protein
MTFHCDEFYIFTNGRVMAFDDFGSQIPELTVASFPEKFDKEKLWLATEEATTFGISKFREWTHQLTKKEAQAMLRL